MPPRRLLYALLLLMTATACGGNGARTTSAELVPQPTPDPTLDAVVRNLPKMLAGVASTPTPTVPPPRPTQKPKPIPTPTARPRR
jgi:hypothetical protein